MVVVEIPENDYGGLAFRGAPYAQAAPEWSFLYLDPTSGTSSPPKGTIRPIAPWMAFQGPLPDGQDVTISMFDHPANMNHPPQWLAISAFPYFNPVITAKGDIPLDAGREFTLRYQWRVRGGLADVKSMESEFKAWSSSE